MSHSAFLGSVTLLQLSGVTLFAASALLPRDDAYTRVREPSRVSFAPLATPKSVGFAAMATF